MKKKKCLEIGKRYWLDSMLNVSAVFVGEIDGALVFNDRLGCNDYLIDSDGHIRFTARLWSEHNFYETENNEL